MDGITAVTARINEIRTLMHPAAMSVPSRAGLASVAAGAVATSPQGTSGTFADALAQAVTRPAGATGAPSVAALQRDYRNGRIPPEALSAIGRGDHRLAAPAAAAFAALELAARRDGVSFAVTDSYRSYDAQVDLVRRKGLYSQGGLAAEPGTSQHGWGLAVDLDLDAEAQAWMRTNGARFGFEEDTPREPWHWAYKG
jgi:D-alanyl-D-alanine carboxypeptidase